jgi:hypothetical protein
VRLNALTRLNIELVLTDGKVTAMPYPRGTAERLSIFSDGVFAVLITVLVLGCDRRNFPPLEHYFCFGLPRLVMR